ncbi:MAG: fumarylacetoacetase [Rhodovulum sp.]
MARRASWVEAANDPGSDFPLENLPYGVAAAPDGRRFCAVAIGDRVLDAATLEAEGLIGVPGGPVCAAPGWGALMARGPAAWAALRARLGELLAEGGDPALRRRSDLRAKCLLRHNEVSLSMPFDVAEFTDFYAGRHHAEAVGSMFRGPESALLPNWLSMPVGYNGRASSVVVSGTGVRRPWGQVKPGDGPPVLAPSARFDFELELGAVIGEPSAGPVTVAEARGMIFGYVLVNDWSARDVQTWEYQPLGPFQSKAAATTVSPWIVPAAALAPFAAPAPRRARPLLPYLADAGDDFLDLELEVTLAPGDGTPTTIARTNARALYYSFPQMIAHHTVSGCPMRVGDLIGSGTISGPDPGTQGCLLELSRGGAEPVRLDSGAARCFLEDGDRVVLQGWAQGAGYRIGFGDCAGRILPALTDPFARQA